MKKPHHCWLQLVFTPVILCLWFMKYAHDCTWSMGSRKHIKTQFLTWSKIIIQSNLKQNRLSHIPFLLSCITSKSLGHDKPKMYFGEFQNLEEPNVLETPKSTNCDYSVMDWFYNFTRAAAINKAYYLYFQGLSYTKQFSQKINTFSSHTYNSNVSSILKKKKNTVAKKLAS